MGRPAKLEVSAINIRIPSDRNRDYAALISHIKSLKLGIKVLGDTCVALTHFNEQDGTGTFSKYSEIDIDGKWFNIDDFNIADQEDVEKVQIPSHLRPNYSAFRFSLSEELHVIAFETYADSKSVSARSIERFFREVLDLDNIQSVYGYVEADVVRSYVEVDKLVNLPDLRELRIIIRRPNSDDVSSDLAAEIEQSLKEQHGEEYEQTIRSKNGDGLVPSPKTKRLSRIAAENGQVVAKSITNGVLMEHNSDEKPLKEVTTYNTDVDNPTSVFSNLAQSLFSQIKASRQSIGSD